jgi:hypothetical protein
MTPRTPPFVWPSWITGLLSREDRCFWKAWYKSHWQGYDKIPDPGADRLVKWTEDHDKMVVARAEKLRADGWSVRSEDDAQFKVSGRTATLSGKLDIFAERDGVVQIIDAKSGKEKDKDKWQVRIYHWALNRTWMPKDARVELYIEYKRGLEPVGPVSLGQTDMIVSVIQQMGSSVEPAKSPSRFECQYCDIAACDKRFKSREDEVGTSEEF